MKIQRDIDANSREIKGNEIEVRRSKFTGRS